MLETLRSEWAAHGPLAVAFDGDGTLWTGDVAEAIWHAMIDQRLVRIDARAALVHEAELLKLPIDADLHALCNRLFQAYRDGVLGEERICEIQAWAFAGWSRPEVDSFVDRVLFEPSASERAVGALPWAERTIPESAAILAEARAVGAPVYLVTASPKHVAERAAAGLGIAPHEVLGSRSLWRDERMLADVERPICYGPGKVAALERVLEGRPLLAAFGDNVFDVPMLHHARFGVMVRPKPRLLATPDSAGFYRLAQAAP